MAVETNSAEHQSNESDEDCEVYFLKPVNEYNIVEKIKEANKVLFEERTEIYDKELCAGAVDLTTEKVEGAPQRRVSFAPNLETYEPDNALLETLTLTREFDEAVAQAKELDRKLTTICEYQMIVKETTASTEDITNQNVTDAEISALVTAVMKEPTVEGPIDSEATPQPDVEVDIVEEICEEIIVMDMEKEEIKPDAVNTSVENPRRMVKMRTFDCAEGDPPDLNGDEQDNRSLTNLLTSDGEEECCSAATFDINDDNSDLDVDDIDADTSINEVEGEINTNAHEDPNSINKETTNTEDYEDDDDDLSIIVASYLPDDFDQKRLSSGRIKPTNKSRLLLAPLRKRFSFRSKSFARNAIGTTFHDGDGSSATLRAHIRPPLPPPEVTDLKLNYRTCCEYRRHLSQPEKLPKYTGYLSEYGLSRQQHELRKENLQRKQRHALQQALKATDAEMRKMQDNEQAFTTWLRNKMRFPVNKTRNMFDVKCRNGACGANSAVRNASGKRK